jgi:hypothetical protein
VEREAIRSLDHPLGMSPARHEVGVVWPVGRPTADCTTSIRGSEPCPSGSHDGVVQDRSISDARRIGSLGSLRRRTSQGNFRTTDRLGRF